MDQPAGIKIPHERLAPETLRGVIEEIVTRDGTELTEAETKIQQVEALLRRGAVELWYDERSRSCSLAEPGTDGPTQHPLDR